jgi:hypothetical protein
MAFETPKDWVPPPQWTPPPEKNLGAESLVYHAARRTVRTIVSLVTLVLLVTAGVVAFAVFRAVGQAAAPLASMKGEEIQKAMGEAMNAIEMAKNAASAAEQAARGAAAPRLPLTCSGNDSVTLTGHSLMLESGTPLVVRGNCTLRLVACIVSGDTGVDAGDNGRVVIEGGSVTSKGPAVLLSGNASLDASASALSGEPAVSASGNAQARIRGSTVDGRSVALKTSGNARVDATGSTVRGKVAGARAKR